MLNWPPRKKWGLGMVVSGLLFLLVGIFAFAGIDAPDWITTVTAVAGSVLNVIGVALVLPGNTPAEVEATDPTARGPPG